MGSLRLVDVLAEHDVMQTLAVALNDEVVRVREVAISLLGRLAVRNPASVMPAMRKTLIQLLSELKQHSAGSQDQEQSASLLGHLIASCRILIRPYVSSILDVLLPRLSDARNNANSCILSTLGVLATVGSRDMTPCVDHIVPLIVGTLQSNISPLKKEVRVCVFFVLSCFVILVSYSSFAYHSLHCT